MQNIGQDISSRRGVIEPAHEVPHSSRNGTYKSRKKEWVVPDDTSYVIVDPSVVLCKWGPTIVKYLAESKDRLILSDTFLAEVLLGSYDHRKYAGFFPKDDIETIKLWKDLFISYDYTKILGRISETDYLNTYEDCLRIIRRRTPPQDSGDMIYTEQVALASTLKGKNTQLLSLCKATPNMMTWLSGKGFMDVKSDLEQEWLSEQVRDKKAWIKQRGLDCLAADGVVFAFINIVTMEPDVLRILETTKDFGFSYFIRTC